MAIDVPSWFSLDNAVIRQVVEANITDHDLGSLERHRKDIELATASAQRLWRVICYGGLFLAIGAFVVLFVNPLPKQPFFLSACILLIVLVGTNVMFFGFSPPGWFFRIFMPKTPPNLLAVKKACLRYEIWLLWYPWQKLPATFPLPKFHPHC